MKRSAIVIGGGIVGVCSALELQKTGNRVILIDPKKPGRETSYGNAGVLSESSVMVINNPSLLKSLPKYFFKRLLLVWPGSWLYFSLVGGAICKFLGFETDDTLLPLVPCSP